MPITQFNALYAGQTFTSQFSFSVEEITHFGQRYDRQPMHICADAAKESRFNTLIASGWQTATVTIDHLIQDHIHTPLGMVGMGIENLRWKKPVFPGDVLTATYTVESVRLSASRPGDGVAVFHCHVANAAGETVLEMTIPTILHAG